MLEVRYNKTTGEVTGWWGSRPGNHKAKLKDRPDEAIAKLGIALPGKPMEAWWYDIPGKKLAPRPGYIEPAPPRDLEAEVDRLTAWAKGQGYE